MAATRDPGKLRDEAQRLVDKGKYDKALDTYLELESLRPEDGGWARRAGDMYRRLGKNGAAVTCFARAADKYAQAGFLVKAVATCKLILGLDPEHSETLERLASLDAERGLPGRRRVPRPATPPTPPPEAVAEGTPPPGDMPREVVSPGEPRQRTVPPGQPLASVTLGSVVEDARHVDPAGVSTGEIEVADAGVVEIPLEVELELHTELAEIMDGDAGARRAAIRETPLFSSLSPESLHSLIAKVALLELDEGAVLFREGDAGSELFVVAEGEVAVIAEGPPRMTLSTLGEGSFFGEIAVVVDQPRSATIAATKRTELLAIDRDVIGDLVDEEPEVLKVILRFLRDRLVDRLIQTSPLFGQFGGAERRRLAAEFRFLEVEQGAPVIRQGTPAEGLFVVLAGSFEVVRADDGTARRLATLAPGDLCGEMSLLASDAAVATVRATSKSFVLELPAARFRELIMTHPQILAFVAELAAERRKKLDDVLSGDADYEEGRIDLV